MESIVEHKKEQKKKENWRKESKSEIILYSWNKANTSILSTTLPYLFSLLEMSYSFIRVRFRRVQKKHT